MPLGMLDEVEVFIGQLGVNVEAGWGVAVTVVRAVHTRRAREADLAAPARAAARSRRRGDVTRGRGAIMHSLSQDHTMKHYKKCHLDE